MKKLLVIILVLVSTITLCSCVKTDTNINSYDDDVEKYHAGLFMPDLEDVGEYNQIEYYVRKDWSIFPEYSMQLLVEYDEDIYLQEKERLETAYTYLDSPQKTDWDSDYYTIPAEGFSVCGFEFKIAIFEDTEYPKNFGLVGVSDEKSEIAYLWLYSPDLDYLCEADANISDEMNEFIEYYFSLE